jgi:hypothetical protein
MNVTKDGVDGVILFELLGGVLGVVVFDPVFLDHLPCRHFLHFPLDHCPPLELAHPVDLHFHHLEPDPRLGFVEMLDWKMTVDLVLVEALRIP